MENKYLRSGNNIKSILKQFAIEYKINELLLDYHLVSYNTYLLDESNNIRIPIQNTDINSYIDSANVIAQEYTISIFRRKNLSYPMLIQIQSNDNCTELRALIYTHRIPQNENLEEIIKNTILKICAYRGIIIGLGWNDINPNIIDIASALKDNGTYPKYYMINISTLKEVVINNNAVRLIITKSNQVSTFSHDSLLLSGGFLKVLKDEVLLQYKKPVHNSPWRNIFGRFYGLGLSYPIGISAGAGIRVEQEDDKIIYKANKNGYVSIVNNDMIVADTVTLDNINAKNIIDIKKQHIKTLVINNDNLAKNVIDSGISLDVDRLKIVGNVDAANITSNDLFINGQVHIKSNIKAKKASILHLKGKLESQSAKIIYCENAVLECDNVFVNYMNDSKVYFTDGKISNIQSNNLFFIQHSLIIGNMLGKNNEFILYPCLYGLEKQKLNNLKEKLFNIDKLRDIFISSGSNLYHDNRNKKLLYEILSKKNANLINENLFNWEKKVIDKHMIEWNNSQKLLDSYNALMNKLNANSDIINKKIQQKLQDIFNINIIFENQCNIDFYVRFIDFYGIEHRYHINANNNNGIKRISLANRQDSIQIICHKE